MTPQRPARARTVLPPAPNLRRRLLQAALAGPAPALVARRLGTGQRQPRGGTARRCAAQRASTHRPGQRGGGRPHRHWPPGASAVFTVGDSAYLVRENTRLELQGETLLTVRVLRLLSGAVASVWSKGADRQPSRPH